MKRLDEILSRRSANATSAEPWATSSGTAESDPAEVCPICAGAGFVRRQRDLDDPLFGRAEPCDCALVETTDVRLRRLERISNLGSLTRFTFESLTETPENAAWLPSAVATAAAYGEEPSGWLLLTGPSGSGKTHLAAAIANRRIVLGQPALFMVVPDLLDHLRSGYDATGEELGFSDLFEQVRDTPFLVLDDIDASAPTPWAKEKLFQVVNHRYNLQLPTVFTSTADLGTLDTRLATRLRDGRVGQVLRLGDVERGGRYREVGGMTRERLAEMDFRSFDQRLTGYDATEREAIGSAARAAHGFADAPEGWLTLTGPHGVGKTHLAAAVANRSLAHGRSVFFAVVPDLLDHLRATFAPGREGAYDDLFEEVRTSQLLVLDDLGAQATSPWALEKLYQIVNYRTLTGLPTVVTTSHSLDQLAATHPRIVSRIGDSRYGIVLAMYGPHYRLGRLPGAEDARRSPYRPR